MRKTFKDTGCSLLLPYNLSYNNNKGRKKKKANLSSRTGMGFSVLSQGSFSANCIYLFLSYVLSYGIIFSSLQDREADITQQQLLHWTEIFIYLLLLVNYYTQIIFSTYTFF